MADGFLGRWSRRKLDAREGRPLPEAPSPAEAAPAPEAHAPAIVASAGPDAAAPPVNEAPAAEGDAADEAPPPPTMQDVQALTPQSDFSRFAARDVTPDVKNAALRKLFTDPRYNVMDGLDVYIGDYAAPDPLPDGMLRQLAGAAFLRLLDEAPAQREGGPPRQPRDVADNPAAESVAQSGAVPDPAGEPPDDADTHLRLQQDDAPGTGGPGQGAA